MDAMELARMFFALIAVLAMIGLLGFAAKKAGLQAGVSPIGRKRRLALVESIALDNKRRAAILRCDGRDHLVILGPASELLVHSGPAPADSEDGAQNSAPILPFLQNAFARSRREPILSADAA
ncbi:MAG: hypothetical protein ABL957_12730 [Parvularculaceae bacterium]